MCGSVSGGKGQGMEYVLQTEGLGKRYGHFKALCDVTMHVPKGAIYGFDKMVLWEKTVRERRR